MEQKTVFVGLSGGVDSSVAALRLKQQGYFVVGVFIKVWHPDFLECNWEAERLDAMRVAAALDIPFLTCDAEEAYKDDVAAYFIREYENGRTPNPDVMCNKHVKFGAFLKFALEHNADYIATGHYAQVKKEGERFVLLRGADSNKDQSYFLWTLTQEQLAHVLLPVGDSEKPAIRKEAEKAGLPTAQKKDSQGICFLGAVDIPEFLSHYIDLKKGDVLNSEGKVIGTHEGAILYTSGQRHGFAITEDIATRAPHYVVARDIAKNTITVGTEKPQQEEHSSIKLTNLNVISGKFTPGQTVFVQTRYRQTPSAARIDSVDADTITLSFTQSAEMASAGQSCVLYDGDRTLGGGIIA